MTSYRCPCCRSELELIEPAAVYTWVTLERPRFTYRSDLIEDGPLETVTEMHDKSARPYLRRRRSV